MSLTRDNITELIYDAKKAGYDVHGEPGSVVKIRGKGKFVVIGSDGSIRDLVRKKNYTYQSDANWLLGLEGRRRAQIYIYAPKGANREMRGLIGKAIRESLGISKWGEPPYLVHYYSAKERAGDAGIPISDSSASYDIQLTDAEYTQVMGAIRRRMEEAGWDGGVEGYHD